MKRPINSQDLYKFKLLDDPQLSPTGEKIAYVITEICESSQKYISNIIILDAKSKQEVKRLSDFKSCSNPSWNYNGDKLAFVSDAKGDNQVWIYDLKLDSGYQLTTMKYCVKDLIWSPVEDNVFFISESKGECELELVRPISAKEVEEEKRKIKEEPYYVTEVVHKFDGIGRIGEKKTHIWMVDLETKNPVKLTDGQYNFRDFSISDDGKKIVYTSDPMSDIEFRPQDMLLWSTDIDTLEINLLIDDSVLIEKPVFNKDMSKVLFIGHEAELGLGTIHKLYEYDISTKKFYCLNKDFGISIGNTALSDIRGGGAYRRVYWNYETDEIYFQMSHEGNNLIYKLTEDRKIVKVIEGKRNIYSFSIDKKFSEIAFCYTTSELPNDIALYSINKGKEDRLTYINAGVLEELEISIPEDANIKSFDGTEIQGWVMKPVNFDKEKKYPMILEIHGGPQMMYSNSFMFEFQLIAAKGYVVYYANPRGSSGYTQEFMAGIQRVNGGVGGGDYKDLMAGVDHMEKMPYVDETRMGVTGGSYGGFMTNWVVGHTNRFKAAVTQRSISNWFSQQGVSDYGYCDSERAHQIDFYNEYDEVMKISPITYVKNVETPLLIIHSENDLRCPLEQAQQLFTHLKMLRKTAEMVIFPNSSHGVSRNGRPDLRVKRLNYIIGWFEKYL